MEVIYENVDNHICLKKYDSNYGMKLRIRTPYDRQFIEMIKSCEWSKTHRNYLSDSVEWEIDFSRLSFDEFIVKSHNFTNNTVNVIVEVIERCLEQLDPHTETEQITEQRIDDNKFNEIEIEAQDLDVTDAFLLDTRRTGKFYQIVFTVNKHIEGLPSPFKLIAMFSRKMSNRSSAKYGRGIANSVNMVADFLHVGHREFISMFENGQSSTQIGQLIRQEGSRIVRIGAIIRPKDQWDNVQIPEYRIFNFSTKVDVIVTFSEIRNIIKTRIGLNVVEEKVGGSIIWKCDTFTEVEYGETLVGRIIISSGNNLKKSAMKVIGEIRIGKCDNSLIPYENVHIKHTTNWEERLIEAVQECVTALTNAHKVIVQAMTTMVSIEDAFEYVNKCDFGLEIGEKISAVRELVKARIRYEFNLGDKTLWSVSQAFTFVGTHSIAQNINVSDATLNTMKKNGYELLEEGLVHD